MTDEVVLCEVCKGREADIMVESIFTASQIPMCNRCILSLREPYHHIVMGLLGVTAEDQIKEWAKVYVEESLKFYGKTMDDLLSDIQSANKFLEGEE